MDLGIQGKVALIGGASKGLGRAAAMSLGREGATLAISSRDAETLEDTAAEITKATGTEVMFVPADFSDKDQVQSLARSVLAEHGRVDILVNNAGGPPTGAFLDFSDPDWNSAYQTNLMSAVRLTRELLPGMKERNWGRIVNLTSIAVKQPIDGLILSNAIRAGVHGWAKTLSNEIARFGVTVNNIMTGYTLTNRVRSMAKNMAETSGKSEEEIIKGMAAGIPMKRIGKPEDVGDLVAYLASEPAGYITGTSIPIDGGYAKGLM